MRCFSARLQIGAASRRRLILYLEAEKVLFEALSPQCLIILIRRSKFFRTRYVINVDNPPPKIALFGERTYKIRRADFPVRADWDGVVTTLS